MKIIGHYKLQNIQDFAAGLQVAMVYELQKDEHGRDAWLFIGRAKRRKSQSWETAIEESIHRVENEN